MRSLSRREFLLAGAAGVVLAACGGGGGDGASPTTIKVRDRDEEPPVGETLNLIVASYVHVAGSEQRLTLAFLNADGSAPVKPDGPVQVSIDGEQVDAEVHADGSLELPYLLVRHTFERPGVAEATATYRGATAKAAIQVLDPAKAAVPLAGQPMIATPSPTLADARGVDPICTRTPACPLHDVSLDAALGEKRPLAVLFATPARCQSRLCGPVLDNLLASRDAFADKVRFVHVEIFAARTGNAVAPAVRAYRLDKEPFLFLAGADGTIRERIDNAFDRTEARQALERLVA